MNANDYPYSMEPMSQYQMVRDWMERFDHVLDKEPNWKDMDLCNSLIDEEQGEVQEELDRWREDKNDISFLNKEALTKELCDLIWVCHFTAAKFGLPIETAFKRVYESNMSKLGDDGKPVLREDGKILKGPNYKPAELGDLFE